MRSVGEVIPAAQLHGKCEAARPPHQPAGACAEETGGHSCPCWSQHDLKPYQYEKKLAEGPRSV